MDGLSSVSALHNLTTPSASWSHDAPLPFPSHSELLWHGFQLSGSIFAAAAILELTVLSTVHSILRTPGGAKLYATAWLYNTINHLGLAPVVYLIGIRLFASTQIYSPLQRFAYVVAVVCIHSMGYYCTHRAMHTKALYWAHRYHHRFNTHICPIAAAAVTQVEYIFAYLTPFIVAGLVLQPIPMDAISIGGLIIGHVNNFIHYPPAEALSAKLVPWFGVSTADHFEHHRKLTTNYAAPTLNVDRLLRLSPRAEKFASGLFSVFGNPIGWSDESKRAFKRDD